MIGGCAEGALPALAAAGAPLDAALEVWGGSEGLRQFLEQAGVPSSKRTDLLWKGSTPLALAARCVRAGVLSKAMLAAAQDSAVQCSAVQCSAAQHHCVELQCCALL
jgi:hypothetical protein